MTRGQVNLTTRKRILNCYVFSVLKYGCESWTLDKSLQKRTAFEHWCYRRMLKVSWKDTVKNTEVLLIMEGKISGVKARGRPRRAWTDDLKDWTELRIGQFGTHWLVNLLLKKKTQEEEEEEEEVCQ